MAYTLWVQLYTLRNDALQRNVLCIFRLESIYSLCTSGISHFFCRLEMICFRKTGYLKSIFNFLSLLAYHQNIMLHIGQYFWRKSTSISDMM